ncbi:3023_t:CDS:2, partial [Funneliformis mosseae]
DTFLNMKEELNIQDKDSEALPNIQDKEFEELLTYNSAEDFSNADSISDKVVDIEADTEEDAKLFVVKVFQNWNHASKFMKKYVAIKGHGHIGHEFYSSAVRFVPLLRKLPKEVIQEIHFLTVVAKANAIIHKFHREVTSDEADTGILLRRLYDKKTEDPR